MNWEAVGAVSTAFSALVIMFTVIVGVRQARAALDQIGEAHRATQLDGMLRMFEKFDDPEFKESRRFIMDDLEAKMAEPGFEHYLTQRVDFPWSRALTTLERMGLLIKMDLLEGEPFYHYWGNMIVITVHKLRPLIALQRTVANNPYLWKDTEWLADDVARFTPRFLAENPRARPSTGKLMVAEDFYPSAR